MMRIIAEAEGKLMKIGMLQTHVYEDKIKNLDEAAEYAGLAVERGAETVILPEMFNCPYETEKFPLYAEERGGTSYNALSAIAKENGIYVVGGSIPEREGERLYNTCFIFDPAGNEIAKHRKAHLFDISIEGKQSFKESDTFTPGDDLCLFEAAGHKFGVAICFDIRFPEYFRDLVLRGAEAILVPAAFNMTTGPLHWELSFRMRAVDNQCYTVGVAPARARNGKYVSFANSIACDPWGHVLVNAGEEAGVSIMEFDSELVKSVRAQLPILSARRPELYFLK